MHKKTVFANTSGSTTFNGADFQDISKFLFFVSKRFISPPVNNGWTPLDSVYDQMEKAKDLASWNRWSAIWDVVVQKGGKFYKKKPWFSAIPDKPARFVAERVFSPINMMRKVYNFK